MGLFSRGSQQQVGIDIGTSSMKAVELKQEGSHLALQNYAVTYGLDLLQHMAAGPKDRTTFKVSEEEMAEILKKLLSFSGIKSEKAVFSIPIFSSFLTIIEMPFMSMDQLEKAVSLQASSYIPVPTDEVVLDWLAIPPSEDANAAKKPVQSVNPLNASQAQESKKKDEEMLSVLLVAIPKEVINYYERIAHLAGLKVSAVESESFSMMRSLLGNDPGVVMLVDFGARSSTLTIVDQGFIRASHTVDLSGKELSESLAKSLNISPERAEEIKKLQGLSPGPNSENIMQVLSPSLGKLVLEYKKMADYYKDREGHLIEKVILTGGASDMPRLKEYLQGKVGVPVVRGNPFARTKYREELAKVLDSELATDLAVATGAAMRDME